MKEMMVHSLIVMVFIPILFSILEEIIYQFLY